MPVPGGTGACPASREEAADRAATTLPALKVTAPRPEVLDLGKFDNPIKPDPTRFDRAYDPGMSVQDVANAGGSVPLLVGYAAQKVAAGVRRIPGWKDQVQVVVARPPPLGEAELAKAARLSAAARGD